ARNITPNETVWRARAKLSFQQFPLSGGSSKHISVRCKNDDTGNRDVVSIVGKHLRYSVFYHRFRRQKVVPVQRTVMKARHNSSSHGIVYSQIYYFSDILYYSPGKTNLLNYIGPLCTIVMAKFFWLHRWVLGTVEEDELV